MITRSRAMITLENIVTWLLCWKGSKLKTDML